MFYGTRRVGQLLGIRPGRINRAIWEGRLSPPRRGPSGAFLWARDDVRRASRVLLRRSLPDEALGEGDVADV